MDRRRRAGKDAFLINIQVVNEPGRFWTITDYPEYAALFGVADPSRSTLIDLRPLRPEVFGVEPEGMTPTMRDLIRQFDAVLLIGGASQGTWEWHFETIPAEATWNGTLELPDGQRLTIAVRGDEGQGRPRPVAARLPDGTIVHFTDAQYDGDQLRFAAMPESGGRFQCRLDPTPAGYDGACSSPEATLRLYIHFEPGRRAR